MAGCSGPGCPDNSATIQKMLQQFQQAASQRSGGNRATTNSRAQTNAPSQTPAPKGPGGPKGPESGQEKELAELLAVLQKKLQQQQMA